MAKGELQEASPREDDPLHGTSAKRTEPLAVGASGGATACCHKPPALVAVAYVCWVALGFIFFFHRLYLALMAQVKSQRTRQLVVYVSLVAGVVLFWVFRQIMQPWYIKCQSGNAMTRDCLFKEQTSAYAACCEYFC